jgi:hypothetical protein
MTAGRFDYLRNSAGPSRPKRPQLAPARWGRFFVQEVFPIAGLELETHPIHPTRAAILSDSGAGTIRPRRPLAWAGYGVLYEAALA